MIEFTGGKPFVEHKGFQRGLSPLLFTVEEFGRQRLPKKVLSKAYSKILPIYFNIVMLFNCSNKIRKSSVSSHNTLYGKPR